MHWDDDRSLYLVKTIFATEELHLRSFDTTFWKTKRNFLFNHRRTRYVTVFRIRVLSTRVI